jgi:hypothetical protein
MNSRGYCIPANAAFKLVIAIVASYAAISASAALRFARSSAARSGARTNRPSHPHQKHRYTPFAAQSVKD